MELHITFSRLGWCRNFIHLGNPNLKRIVNKARGALTFLTCLTELLNNEYRITFLDLLKTIMEDLKPEPFEIQDPLGIRVRTDLCDSLAPSLSDQAPTMAGADSGNGDGTGGVAMEPPLPNPAAASSSSKHYRSVTTLAWKKRGFRQLIFGVSNVIELTWQWLHQRSAFKHLSLIPFNVVRDAWEMKRALIIVSLFCFICRALCFSHFRQQIIVVSTVITTWQWMHRWWGLGNVQNWGLYKWNKTDWQWWVLHHRYNDLLCTASVGRTTTWRWCRRSGVCARRRTSWTWPSLATAGRTSRRTRSSSPPAALTSSSSSRWDFIFM